MGDHDNRRVTGRLVRQGEDERAFDREFWGSMTGEQRVELLWDMVNEARALKGLEGDEPRLQRSVGRLVRP
jgi:hypothetical protein